MDQTALTVESRAQSSLTVAQQLIIRTDVDRVNAGDLLKGIKALIKEVKADREDERLAARKLMDLIVAGQNRNLRPLEYAETIIKQKVLAYIELEEIKRQVEEDRLNSQAKADEEERMIKEAEDLEDMGAPEEAQKVLDSAPVIPPVFVPKTTPKIEGQHVTTLWKCKEVDFGALVQAVASGKAPIHFLQINQVYANYEVKRLKEKFDTPGLESYTVKSMASRSY